MASWFGDKQEKDRIAITCRQLQLFVGSYSFKPLVKAIVTNLKCLRTRSEYIDLNITMSLPRFSGEERNYLQCQSLQSSHSYLSPHLVFLSYLLTVAVKTGS